MRNYCKYSSVANCTVCTELYVNMLCGKMLTDILFLCEQQSAAIYIHCATVWGDLEKENNKNESFVSLLNSISPSECSNARNAEKCNSYYDFIILLFR